MNEKIPFAGKKYINERFLYVMIWCGLLGVNLLGVLLDILAFLGYPGIIVENLADYAAVVIQVQATIAALGLTVVTLLGNVLNKKILGVGVAEFILNRQHRILNQRNAINEKKQQKTVTFLCMEAPIQMLEETSLVDRIADVLDSNLVSLLYSVWFKDHLEHYVIKNDKEALENYLAKVSTYETDFILDLNTRRFEISLISVETVICDLSLKEIDERIRQDADVCSVNVTNNIWLNYSREKAREYIKKSRKRIDIRCTLECRFYADIIGIATHVQ